MILHLGKEGKQQPLPKKIKEEKKQKLNTQRQEERSITQTVTIRLKKHTIREERVIAFMVKESSHKNESADATSKTRRFDDLKTLSKW